MSEGPVNLNRFRKAADRTKAKARADENAIKFGRTKEQRMLEKARAEKDRRDLDGHKVEE